MRAAVCRKPRRGIIGQMAAHTHTDIEQNGQPEAETSIEAKLHMLEERLQELGSLICGKG